MSRPISTKEISIYISIKEMSSLNTSGLQTTIWYPTNIVSVIEVLIFRWLKYQMNLFYYLFIR